MRHAEMDKLHKMQMDIIKAIIPLSIVAKCFVNYWNYSEICSRLNHIWS